MDSYETLSMSAKNESVGCCTPSGLNELNGIAILAQLSLNDIGDDAFATFAVTLLHIHPESCTPATNRKSADFGNFLIFFNDSRNY